MGWRDRTGARGIAPEPQQRIGARQSRGGEIAEAREVLRLNPNNGLAHFGIGIAPEVKGDRQGAQEEFRAAYELNPQNPDYRKAYERLVYKTSH
ncbi:MAG: hypothetical protein ABSA41_00605 [Terriglobia bacterium]